MHCAQALAALPGGQPMGEERTYRLHALARAPPLPRDALLAPLLTGWCVTLWVEFAQAFAVNVPCRVRRPGYGSRHGFSVVKGIAPYPSGSPAAEELAGTLGQCGKDI